MQTTDSLICWRCAVNIILTMGKLNLMSVGIVILCIVIVLGYVSVFFNSTRQGGRVWQPLHYASQERALVHGNKISYRVLDNICISKQNEYTKLVMYNARSNGSGNITVYGPLNRDTIWAVQYVEAPAPSNVYSNAPVAFFIKETFPGNWYHFNENTLISKCEIYIVNCF